MITITQADNGFVVESQDDGIGVFQDGKGFEDNKHNIISMFYHILDCLGESGSKHDEHRIKISCKCEQEGEQNEEDDTSPSGSD